MIFLIVFLASAIICPIFYFLYERYYTDGFGVVSFIAGVLASICLIFSVYSFKNDKTLLIEYKETQTLINEFKDASEIERMGIVQKKIDLNKELVKRKSGIEFCSLFYFYPNEIKELEYIQ